ncbi:hypothetical protein SAMN06893096_106135 [Geodermatophilus pulveris]|uniref:Uncharacterized protein n=1 Tax=Geodermatophilus pulveris TaxID=1564159 RepID=A0A239GDW1_9ACTN|nr:hypothetical protein [Geodermatophilus pulveris]SNS66958.1 hypothetical protein SAMN06893096_106135 [Geodermatophilus pulveris]
MGAYGVGMALALVGTGLLLVRARGWVERWSTVRALTGRRTGGALTAVRALPLLTAGLVVAIGAGLTVRAVAGL